MVRSKGCHGIYGSHCGAGGGGLSGDLRGEYGLKKPAGIKQQRTYVDRTLIFVVLFLLCFGLIMIYSASAYAAMRSNLSSAFYLFSQARATILGIIFMFIVSRVDYHILRKAAWPAYFGSCAVILLVLSPL